MLPCAPPSPLTTKRFPGYQDVVLISDGDDPADDREWARGSDEARRAQIPVHTVGVGNHQEDFILTFGEELAPTRLREEPLQRIAAETNGRHIAACATSPARGVLPFAPGTASGPGRQR